MRVDLLTREYPPHIYGGAGVHVAELSKVLAAHADVHVHAFDGPREPGAYDSIRVTGYDYLDGLESANSALKTFGVDLAMAGGVGGTDIVHSHTWYANMAGHWASLLHEVPHVISAHSLEPLRPWKREQLGGGYNVSSWAEKTAYEAADGIIAVSHAMRADILRCYPNVDPSKVHVIHNGIDLDGWRAPETDEEIAAARAYTESYGLNPTHLRSRLLGGLRARRVCLVCCVRLNMCQRTFKLFCVRVLQILQRFWRRLKDLFAGFKSTVILLCGLTNTFRVCKFSSFLRVLLLSLRHRCMNHWGL